MRPALPTAFLLLAATGAALVLGEFSRTSPVGPAAVLAAEPAPARKTNLSLWVPEEELTVWDPMNPNVNPVPWRVYGAMRDDGRRESMFRHTAVGKRVRVEGIAWGYDVETDLPKSRVLFEGGVVLVRGVDFNRPQVRGRSVRVVGTLRLGAMPSPGFRRQYPNYYFLESESFMILDRVAEPNVVLEPSAE
jgi:hypothetical protein